MYISFSDYKDENGNIDYKEYHKACVDAGQECMKCGTYILNIQNLPGPIQCRNCKCLKDKDEITHHAYVRCPACEDLIDINDDYYEIWDEGDHEVSCNECNFEFEINTIVERTFESPALLKKEE